MNWLNRIANQLHCVKKRAPHICWTRLLLVKFKFIASILSHHMHTFYAHTLAIRVQSKKFNFEGQHVLKDLRCH